MRNKLEKFLKRKSDSCRLRFEIDGGVMLVSRRNDFIKSEKNVKNIKPKKFVLLPYR